MESIEATWARIQRQSGLEFDIDLFLAFYLSLASGKHAIFVTDDASSHYVSQLLSRIVTNVFSLTSSILQVEPQSYSVNPILKAMCSDVTIPSIPSNPMGNSGLGIELNIDGGYEQEHPDYCLIPQTRLLKNCIIAANMHEFSRPLGALFIELFRAGKVKVGDTIYVRPKPFLVINLFTRPNPKISMLPSLVDSFILSYEFRPFPHYLTDVEVKLIANQALEHLPRAKNQCLVSEAQITQLANYAVDVTIVMELRQYMNDLLVFLRMNRAVKSGVSPAAARDFELLVRLLTPLHGKNFAIPSIVSTVFLKTYTHRLVLRQSQEDRTLMYGATLQDSRMYLSGMTTDKVLNEVLEKVDAPL